MISQQRCCSDSKEHFRQMMNFGYCSLCRGLRTIGREHL